MANLPVDEKKDLSRDELRHIIDVTSCIGVITRQGKDAAGRELESEFYYIPEMDSDESRRAAVVDGLRKPSLRNCRKQHKVCCPVSAAPHMRYLFLTNICSNITGSVPVRHKREDLSGCSRIL